jgi:hypothetical protein
MTKSIVVYDLEIAKSILGKNEFPKPNIEYCNGWSDHANMGITVLAAYDLETDQTHVYCEDNLPEFFKLLSEREYRAGFNNINFDDKVLLANGYEFPANNHSYDLMKELMRGAGTTSFAGFNLDACCITNFNICKSGNGALAPVLWQQGKIGEVINYCIRDVFLTTKLLNRILDAEHLYDPRSNEKVEIKIRLPWA